MKRQILETETFGTGTRNYFIDFAKAENDSDYIRITRSDRQADNSFKRSSVVIFEEDFMFLIESFSMLFNSVIHRTKMSDSLMLSISKSQMNLENVALKAGLLKRGPESVCWKGVQGQFPMRSCWLC